MKRITLASHNVGKIAELKAFLAPLGWEAHGLPEGAPVPRELNREEGGTFEGNARLKAETACRTTGGWALADDSGLCVAALGGAPRVDTAHFGGFLRLLEVMTGKEDRAARFVCVLAFARPGEATIFFTGEEEGTLTHAPRGTGGHGYDPVFVPRAQPGGEARTFAEMSTAEKNAISHRGMALRQLEIWLRENSAQRDGEEA